MLLVRVIALALIVKASGTEVDDVKYEGIGCYNDNLSRPLPTLLKNFRDTIVWKVPLQPIFDRIIKDCAKLAHSKGYLYFGIQFYGECWTGTDAYKTFDKEGNSTRCKYGVGEELTNFVYMITQDRPECSRDVYKKLSEPSRSIHESSSTIFHCDKNLMDDVRWYRFTGAAGNGLALKPPFTEQCTTLSGGWMKGSLPTDKSAPVTRKVCFPTVLYPDNNGLACDPKFNKIYTRVRNCGHFFVYELEKPPNCPYRYCGDTISIKDY